MAHMSKSLKHPEPHTSSLARILGDDWLLESTWGSLQEKARHYSGGGGGGGDVTSKE